ncbi:MAG: GNAT family N-acetyltransferase [Clostridiales bacterium]|nr:GNAT family N-acetyltransferase [Clostridiales bacterium]
MIIQATEAHTAGMKELWKKCFTQEDPRENEFFFKAEYKPEYGYVLIEDSKVAAGVCRMPHALMFNGRVLRTSMIVGVATLPEYRNRGYMHQIMDTVLNACEHSELITLVQAYDPSLYAPYGFEMIYKRSEYVLTRMDVKRITNFGCAYEPTPIDMLKVYSAFIRRFNGFYARDLNDFEVLRKEIIARGGKVVAYYNGKNQIMGYATMFKQGAYLKIEECVYLDSMSLIKLLNAALQERATVILNVSQAENLSVLFPNAGVKIIGSTMARLNNPQLFSRLFRTPVHTIQDAYALSAKPLNLNETM